MSALETWQESDDDADAFTIILRELRKNTKHEQSVSVRLHELMRDEQQFESLVHWMYREFSFENILCFIEMVQFKQYLIDRVKHVQTDGSSVGLQCEYEFYANMPKSSIVYGEAVEVNVDVVSTSTTPSKADEWTLNRVVSISEDAEQRDTRYVQMARALYVKYLQTGAEFEVNISAMLRRRYEALEAKEWKVEEVEMVAVFDAVIDEVLHFIRQSYSRSQMGV